MYLEALAEDFLAARADQELSGTQLMAREVEAEVVPVFHPIVVTPVGIMVVEAVSTPPALTAS